MNARTHFGDVRGDYWQWPLTYNRAGQGARFSAGRDGLARWLLER